MNHKQFRSTMICQYQTEYDSISILVVYIYLSRLQAQVPLAIHEAYNYSKTVIKAEYYSN